MGMEAPPLKNPSETSYLNLRPPVILRHRPAWNPYSSFTNHPERSYSAQYDVSREQRRANHFRSRNRTFLTFLSSYGPGGVSLRELIMLGTLRQTGRESKNHWLADGEVGTFEEDINEIVFERQDLVFWWFPSSGVVDRNAIQAFQGLLESLDSIDVRYPEGTQSDEASQYWHTDERIWIIRGSESSEPSAPKDEYIILRGLLDLLIGMPDKDVFALAQRQREMYYYHAHLLIRRVIRSQRFLEKHRLLLMQAVFVTLQLLTHRYQIGDSLLLDFVRDNSVRSLHPPWDVMLLWAELKEKAFREDYDGLCTIRDRALYLVNSNEGQYDATPRQNGFLGFVLVDLMKSAKALHFEDIVVDAVKAGKKWADTAQWMDTRIEKTALCEILATFDIHARKDIIQKEYYLFYGYHLSRAGFLVQGDQFLARGLESRDSLPLWSYEMERVSNALRLGHQNEAAQMLKSIRALALYYRDKDYSNCWKHSGECPETFVLLYLYEADCSASAGRLDDACAKLKSGISITSSVYDAYIRILRVALEMRLLEILMRQGSLEEALPVALNLASEILDERTSSTLAPDVVYGIAQQLLDLSNTLFSAGNAAASMALLKSITSIGVLVPGELSKELKLYVEQRMAKARHFSGTIELSGHDPNPSTLDTGIEDTKSLVQTNPSYDPTIPTAKEATFHNPDIDTEARYIIDRVEKANREPSKPTVLVVRY